MPCTFLKLCIYIYIYTYIWWFPVFFGGVGVVYLGEWHDNSTDAVGGSVAMGFALTIAVLAIAVLAPTRTTGTQKKPHLVLHLSSETSDKDGVGWGACFLRWKLRGSFWWTSFEVTKTNPSTIYFSQRSRKRKTHISALHVFIFYL